jgi:hypothetical protein
MRMTRVPASNSGDEELPSLQFTRDNRSPSFQICGDDLRLDEARLLAHVKQLLLNTNRNDKLTYCNCRSILNRIQWLRHFLLFHLKHKCMLDNTVQYSEEADSLSIPRLSLRLHEDDQSTSL